MNKALIDLHVHSVASGHALSTIKENIDYANSIGLKYLGISDHCYMMDGTTHKYYFDSMNLIPRNFDNLKILRGVEANILDYEGNIDAVGRILDWIDYVIISLHIPCIKPGTIEENTSALLGAMNNDKVKIIGHLDDSRYPVDYEKVVMAAKEKNIIFEINNSSLSPASYRVNARENYSELLKYCKKYNSRVIMNSDAHIADKIASFDHALKCLEEENFPMELVVNFDEDFIKEFFMEGINCEEENN